ncbi:MAG: DUF4124 domain-containing protein [Pseudomonadota bacterium]
MSRRITESLILLALFLPVSSMGDEVYRTVDESGQVIFSDSPPANADRVEKIELPPGPSAGSVRATESRNRAIRKRLDKVQGKHSQETHSRNRRIKQAEKALAEAETRLVEAKKLKNEDRQSLAGGKSRIRPEYFERIKKAESEVEMATKKLKKVRRSR